VHDPRINEAAHALLVVASSLSVGLADVAEQLRSGALTAEQAAVKFAAWAAVYRAVAREMSA
jgi:hypothetical protein